MTFYRYSSVADLNRRPATFINMKSSPKLDRSKLTAKQLQELQEHERREATETFERNRKAWSQDHELIQKYFKGDPGPPREWYPTNRDSIPTMSNSIVVNWMLSKYPELRGASYRVQTYIYHQYDMEQQYQKRLDLLHELFVAGANIIDNEQRKEFDLYRKYTDTFDELFKRLEPIDPEERADLKDQFKRYREMRQREREAIRNPTNHANGCFCPGCLAREEERKFVI